MLIFGFKWCSSPIMLALVMHKIEILRAKLNCVGLPFFFFFFFFFFEELQPQ